MQTSIERSSDRRKSASPRIPVDLLVELCAADERSEARRGERALDSWDDVGDSFTDSYDADGLDLSATGLRLRSAVLPDVGQRLRCRFDLPDASDAEAKCEAEGRVVWSNDAGRHGEFGLRFESLTPSVESALARWAMERGPSTLPGTEPAPEPMSAMPTSAMPIAKTASIVAPKIVAPKITEAPSPAFGLARVRFDGVSSAIEAEVSLRDETRMDVEQPLPFFELGRLASVDADGSTERRRLEHVSLKIENGIPKLVLGFVAAPSSSAGTLTAPSFDDEVASESSADSTMQDVSLDAALARTQSATEERVVEARSSSSGAWVTDESAVDDSSGDDDDVLRADAGEPEDLEAKASESERESVRSRARRALFGSAEDSLEDGDPQIQAHRKKKLDEVRRVLLDGDELPDAPPSSAGQEKAARPAALELAKTKARALSSTIASSMGPAFTRVMAAVRAGWASFVANAGPRAKSAWAALTAWIARAASVVSERVKERAPRLGAMLSRSPAKEKRRTTAAPSAQAAVAAAPRRQQRAAQNTGSHATGMAAQAAPETSTRPRLPLRWVLLGIVALGAVGSLAYALGGGPSEPAPIVVPTAAAPASTDEGARDTTGEAPAIEAAPASVPTSESSPELSSASASTPAPMPSSVSMTEPSALAAPSTDEGRLPMPGYPSIGRASSASGSATTVSAGAALTSLAALAAPTTSTVTPSAPAAGPVTSGRTFGSERVEGGQTTSLRMSLAPTTLEGQADPHGFTVTIRGALSLDRAAGIARANPAVDRASVLNRGDHAVLDVRFVEGRSPAYRVEMRGESVDVIIGR